VLSDRMACRKGGVVANVVVPSPDYVRLATTTGSGPTSATQRTRSPRASRRTWSATPSAACWSHSSSIGTVVRRSGGAERVCRRLVCRGQQPSPQRDPRDPGRAAVTEQGPVAEQFLVGAAAVGVTKLGTEIAEILTLPAAHGTEALRVALERAVSLAGGGR
jgi:hypothetical protein